MLQNMRPIALSVSLLLGAIHLPGLQAMDAVLPAVGSCTICLEDLTGDTIELPCHHKLHKVCLQNMLKSTENATCTLCRAPIPAKVRQQLNLTITCEDLLSKLGTFFARLLSPQNFERFKEALLTITRCDEERLALMTSLDISPEVFHGHLNELHTFITQCQKAHLYDEESLQGLYAQWRPLTQSQLVIFLKDLIETYGITQETFYHLKGFIAHHPQGVALLEAIDQPLDLAGELAVALKEAPGRSLFQQWFVWFSEKSLVEHLQSSDVPTLLKHLCLAIFYLSESIEPLDEHKESHNKLLELQLACFLALRNTAELPQLANVLSAKLQDEKLPYLIGAVSPVIRGHYANLSDRGRFNYELNNQLTRIRDTPLEVLQAPAQNNNLAPAPDHDLEQESIFSSVLRNPAWRMLLILSIAGSVYKERFSENVGFPALVQLTLICMALVKLATLYNSWNAHHHL